MRKNGTGLSDPDFEQARYVYDDESTQAVLDAHLREGKQLGTVLLAKAAESSGAEIQWLNNMTCVARTEGKDKLLVGYISDQSEVSTKIVGNKFLTQQKLRDANVPVPMSGLAKSELEVLELWNKINGHITIKPLNSYGGKGVTTNLKDKESILKAYRQARNATGAVLVEAHVRVVDEYRVLSTPTECVSVVKRVLPYVVGDGQRSIEDLIVAKNKTRQENPSLAGRPIPIDGVTRRCLAEQGAKLNDVLPSGSRLTVRDIGGLSSGGEAYECTDVVKNHIKDVCCEAVRAIPGLTWGGCDILVDDKGDCFVIEVNSTPGISGSMFPVFGNPKNVANIIWSQRRDSTRKIKTDSIFAPASSARSKARVLAQSSPYGAGMTFGQFAFDSLAPTGYTVKRIGSGLVEVHAPTSSAVTTFTNELSGPADLAVARRVLRRHGTVRALLRRAGVPRVQGREIRNVTEAQNFRKRFEKPRLDLLPARAAWRSEQVVPIAPHENLQETHLRGHRRWFIQVRRPGTRISAIASAQETLCLLGKRETREIPYEALAEASALAVSAVQAVPELRWAVVHMVVRPARSSSDGPFVFVEGLNSSFTLAADDQELTGSLIEAVEAILQPAFCER